LSSSDDLTTVVVDDLRAGVLDQLREVLGTALADALHKPGDDLWLRVRTEDWVAAGEALKAAGFHYFCFLSAIDWLPSPYGKGEDDPTEPPPERETEVRQGYCGGETRLQLLARLTDLERHVGVSLKADVPDAEQPEMPTWTGVFAGAGWHERETWEMFGIHFVGHPDLRHLYLPTDFEGFPLRKDYPLLARMVKPWPGIVDVEPMPADLDDDAAPADGADAAADAG
jgi:NADH-quinone oxidoreductase subunit C